ncbi:hypothetical protein B0H11DRAFT_2366954 [Mycena galericulata]|nr:hypothetical protein B0H11DRAFT_2366954 [Mycena galericulata]
MGVQEAKKRGAHTVNEDQGRSSGARASKRKSNETRRGAHDDERYEWGIRKQRWIATEKIRDLQMVRAHQKIWGGARARAGPGGPRDALQATSKAHTLLVRVPGALQSAGARHVLEGRARKQGWARLRVLPHQDGARGQRMGFRGRRGHANTKPSAQAAMRPRQRRSARATMKRSAQVAMKRQLWNVRIKPESGTELKVELVQSKLSQFSHDSGKNHF